MNHLAVTLLAMTGVLGSLSPTLAAHIVRPPAQTSVVHTATDFSLVSHRTLVIQRKNQQSQGVSPNDGIGVGGVVCEVDQYAGKETNAEMWGWSSINCTEPVEVEMDEASGHCNFSWPWGGCASWSTITNYPSCYPYGFFTEYECPLGAAFYQDTGKGQLWAMNTLVYLYDVYGDEGADSVSAQVQF